jgi:hypothetical protein
LLSKLLFTLLSFTIKTMKKILLLLAVIIVTAGTTLNSCKTSAQKAEIIQIKQQQVSTDEYLKFRIDSEARIVEQEKSIAGFKSKISIEKKDNRKKYELALARLEQKNTEMKKKLNDYHDDENDQWVSFRSDFNREMEQLGRALKNFYYQ